MPYKVATNANATRELTSTSSAVSSSALPKTDSGRTAVLVYVFCDLPMYIKFGASDVDVSDDSWGGAFVIGSGHMLELDCSGSSHISTAGWGAAESNLVVTAIEA